MTSKKVRIQIEGNTGSGKSTFARMLQKVLNEEYEIESEVYCEPVDEWSKNNLLSKALEYPSVYLFELQTKIMTTFFKQRRVQPKVPVSIYERSLWSSKNIFQRLYFDEKILNSSQIQTLDLLHEEFSMVKPHLSKPTVVIYIELSPEECYKRIWKRTEEDLCDKEADRLISLAQLRKLNEQYEKALESYDAKKILRLDGTLDPLTLARAAANVMISPDFKSFQIFANKQLDTKTKNEKVEQQEKKRKFEL